ncbi:phage/plasmid replication domain-containing protein [Pseudomonas viridiflava]|uniref:phage/plasmid replication domain-containing protein n=1 Tax=Pseudomonas viridiflava TaxID=33069 RepID=UPI001F1504BF|nr:phage/plasmid replication protein [Pseudomonas viridiflava]
MKVIDWLKVHQEYDFDLPQVVDIVIETICARTGQRLSTRQPQFKHDGSFSTAIHIKVEGRKLTVDGNPSRIDRLDNLFGFTTIEQCIAVYNRILAEYNLPAFTRCTSWQIRSVQEDKGVRSSVVSNGACIDRIDLTTNRSVGEGNVLPYLRALSTQRIGYSIGHLYPNGRTVDWKSIKGNVRLQYRKAYDKAFEIADKLIPKVKKLLGEQSSEFQYVQQVYDFCIQTGVVRMEQELKQEFLIKHQLHFWGLFDEEKFQSLHDEFLGCDSRLQVTAMEHQTIADKLLADGIVNSVQSANATASYAYKWMNGHTFDFKKSQVKKVRAWLRRIGIDIANPSDSTRHPAMFVKRCEEVVTCDVLSIPAWYKRPNHLQLAA